MITETTNTQTHTKNTLPCLQLLTCSMFHQYDTLTVHSLNIEDLFNYSYSRFSLGGRHVSVVWYIKTTVKARPYNVKYLQ